MSETALAGAPYPLVPIDLSPLEKRTFRLQLASSVAAGLCSGVLLNNEYIATNGLGASVWQITLLTMIWPMSNFLSVFINRMVESRGWWGRAFLAVAAMRVPICLMSLSASVNVLLVLLALFSAADSVVSPAQNTIIRNCYREGRRGALYGWAVSFFTLVSVPAALMVGILLDLDFQWYRILFLALGLFGAVHAGIFWLMTRGLPDTPRSRPASPREIARSLWEVFRKDREFARFEAYFMLYGFAFMMILPAVPFFARDYLHLDYGEYAAAKGVIAQVGILLLSPFMGIRAERMHPFRFTGFVCLALSAYPALIAMGAFLQPQAKLLFYAAFGVYSASMAGVNVSWNMSSLYFAPPGQEATYQGLHITMTAVRGFVAPIMGNLLLQCCGHVSLFGASTGLFLLAGLMYLRRFSQRRRLGL